MNSEDLKDAIKNYLSEKYFANRKKTEKKKSIVPESMEELISFYIDQRSIGDVTKGTKPLAANTVKKYQTLQKVLSGYNKKLLVTDINDIWRNNFVKHLNEKHYSENTQVKFIKDIKMFCIYANKEHNVSKQVLGWEINSRPKNVSEYVTFSFADLDKLESCEMPTDSLNNVKDWFLISCFTSVRVSELLTMNTENIITSDQDYFVKVYEKKNVSEKIVYLMPKVVEILNKRNGNFPKRITDQKYNEYLKKVFELAGFNQIITHGKLEKTLHGTRKIIKEGPMWEFVTSHSGRATYVTLFSDKLPSEILQIQTNHHSKEMLDRYDKTEEQEKMLKRAKLVASAHKDISENPYKVQLKIV